MKAARGFSLIEVLVASNTVPFSARLESELTSSVSEEKHSIVPLEPWLRRIVETKWRDWKPLDKWIDAVEVDSLVQALLRHHDCRGFVYEEFMTAVRRYLLLESYSGRQHKLVNPRTVVSIIIQNYRNEFYGNCTVL